MSTGQISSIGSDYSAYLTIVQRNRQQRQQDAQALANALNSNDLPGAQAAFAALQKDLPKLAGGEQNGQTADSNNPLATDFQKLSQALQSGDLSSAQSAFAQLQQDLQTARSGGHHHHRHGGSGSTPSPTTSTSTASPSTSTSSSAGVDSDGDHDGSGQQTLNVQA